MFQMIADRLGFPVDQIRYILLLFMSYPLGYVLRHVLHPSRTPLFVRHLFSISFGLLFGFLCFGMQMFILFGVVGVCYALLRFTPATTVQRYTMVWAMGSMSAAHYYRMMTDYGGWHLDFTGPLMIIVQKVTLVAYALHDGKAHKDSSLNADQRKQKIDVCPTPLEYFTYIFNFHSLLAGPLCTIKEFVAFMDGSNLRPLDNPNQFAKAKDHVGEPSAAYSVVTKLIYSIISIILHIILDMYVQQSVTYEPQYNLLTRIYLVYFYAIKVRCKYYFVWQLGDSINNLCGLGFNGYDKIGHPQWDLITNVYVSRLEFATNMKAVSDNWNITTGLWLRRVCYERVTVSPTIMTYTLSAWWHGFYPGYYLSFIFFGVATEAARKMRRLFRHHFQSSLPRKWFYGVITCVCARFYLDYGIMPFDLLWIPRGLLFWSYAYFVPHLLLIIVMFLFPSGKRSQPAKEVKTQPGDQDVKTKAD